MQQEHKLRVSDSVEDDAEGGAAAQAPVVLDPRIPTRSSELALARATKKRRGCVRK